MGQKRLNLRTTLKSLFDGINSENIGKTARSINKEIQDFGKSMQDIQDEFQGDIKKSNQRRIQRESIDRGNLEKLWAKKKFKL